MGRSEALRLRTKTEQSECYVPMSPALQAELKAHLASRTDDSEYLFPRQIGTDKRQEDLQPPPSVRENQTGDGFQGVHVEKSKDTGDESMEGAKEAKLSGRGEAHNQGVERLFRNTGLCAGIRPKHRQALNETHESDYYV
jgi:hypothetical protein